MVGIVKWLRQWIVAPLCVGSNPTIHPICVFKAVNDLHSFKHFIGPSPRGKATDFDSVIPQVRILPVQPKRESTSL